MLESVLSQLRSLSETANIHSMNAQNAFISLIPEIEITMMNALVEAANEAMNKIPEYNNPQARPLRERLINNLSAMEGNRPVHIRVHSDGRVFVFNEEFAGTEDDFEEAKFESKVTSSLRYRFWKYGIYKPDVEGDDQGSEQEWFNRAVDRLPSYQDIILERLAIWETKAPYWYFIEYGNFGAGKAYPQFGGTFFITRFRQDAQQAIKYFIDELTRTLSDNANKALNKSFLESRVQSPEHKKVTFNKVMQSARSLFGRVFRSK